MKVVCKEDLNKDEVKEFECDGFTARNLTPYEHEIILKKDGKDLALIQVNARPRQGTDPLRFQSAQVVADDGIVLWSGDIAGTAIVEMPTEIATRIYTVDEMRKVLTERKVRYRKAMGMDELQTLLLSSGGMPTVAEMGEEIAEEEVEKDGDE